VTAAGPPLPTCFTLPFLPIHVTLHILLPYYCHIAILPYCHMPYRMPCRRFPSTHPHIHISQNIHTHIQQTSDIHIATARGHGPLRLNHH
jgi:hypothetical protein